MKTTLTSIARCTSLALGTMLFFVTTSGCSSIGWRDSKTIANRVDQPSTSKKVVSEFEKKRNEAQFRAAETRWQQGDNMACEEMLVSLLARDPDDKPSVQLLADLYASQDRDDEAIRLLTDLLAKHPDDAQIHHSMGLLFESTGDAVRAKPHFVKAAQLDPSNELYSKFLKDRPAPSGNVADQIDSVGKKQSPVDGVSASISG